MLNTIAVMGRLVACPELRKTMNGISTTTFTIACDRSYVAAGKERETDFFDIVAWRGTAEFACRYFRKGQLVAVNGSLQTRSYENKEGKRRKVYEIIADNLHFAEGKPFANNTNEHGLDISPSGEYDAPAPADDFAVIDDDEDMPF